MLKLSFTSVIPSPMSSNSSVVKSVVYSLTRIGLDVRVTVSLVDKVETCETMWSLPKKEVGAAFAFTYEITEPANSWS